MDELFIEENVDKSTEDAYCFHCHERIPPGVNLAVLIDNQERRMCCRGCEAVAQSIVDFGLSGFYQHRTGISKKPDELLPDKLQELSVFDDPDVQKNIVEVNLQGEQTITVVIKHIVCPACIWLIENQLQQENGIIRFSINHTNNRAVITWDNNQIKLSQIFKLVSRLGYEAIPYSSKNEKRSLESERKAHLRRIALSGLFGMQVMMISIALYFGDWTGMKTEYRSFFYWVALLLTTPVMFYSAKPFFTRAWRDLQFLTIGMDVPVSLGLVIAYIASLVATLRGEGDIYFDSVVMFVFFLSLARYIEFMMQKKASESVISMGNILPLVAKRVIDFDQNQTESIPLAKLLVDDIVMVYPGEIIPADGLVVDGTSCVDESIISGESLPLAKEKGDSVIAGSHNIESGIRIKITRVGKDTTLSHIVELMQKGHGQKAELALISNRIAGWFVLFVICLAAGASAYWFIKGHEDWVAITVSVLIITCPCALSLAVPTALSAAGSALMKLGIAVVNLNSINTLANITKFVFDKTGTLTTGNFHVSKITSLSGMSVDECIDVVNAIESHSEHPLARAVCSHAGTHSSRVVNDIKNYPGEGITGKVNGIIYFAGNSKFIKRMTGFDLTHKRYVSYQDPGGDTSIILADDNCIHCIITLSDDLRPGIKEFITFLRQQEIPGIIISGDHQLAVEKIARELNLDKIYSSRTPQQKLEKLQDMVNHGELIAMTGDGVNDAPVLAAASVSIAVSDSTDLAKSQADIILLNEDMGTLIKLMSIAYKMKKIIRENISWAIIYNTLALPAALFGLVAPWLAALGMSLSSLIVVCNSSRLSRLSG